MASDEMNQYLTQMAEYNRLVLEKTRAELEARDVQLARDLIEFMGYALSGDPLDQLKSLVSIESCSEIPDFVKQYGSIPAYYAARDLLRSRKARGL